MSAIVADEFASMSVRRLADVIRRRQASVEEVVRATLERIGRLDGDLHSFITVAHDAALSAARSADAEIAGGTYRGLLHGIPIGIKDHIDTAGIATTHGSKLFRSRVPSADAPVVRKLKAAGAVVIGKANMNVFAGGDSGWNADFGKIGNPRFPGYSPGGSSGGSGAQVAAGLVPLSIGSDNGGSIRIPAALCGIVGIKPTFGRVSTDGVAPRSFSSDHVGPLARSVDDAAIALDVMSGHAPGSSTTFDRPFALTAGSGNVKIGGWRIGVDRQYCRVGDAQVLEAFAAALKRLEELGATLHDVTWPDFDELFAVADTIFQPEVVTWFEAMRHAAGADVPEEFRDGLAPAQAISAVDYLRAQQRRREIQIAFARSTRDVDIVVSPAYFLSRRPYPERADILIGGYPPIGGRTATPEDALHYGLPFNFLGLPAVTVPCAFTTSGAVGLQIAGRAWEEARILTAARAFEAGAPAAYSRPKGF